MAAVRFCGEWLICSCDQRLVAVHSKHDRDPFTFDCGLAEKRPRRSECESDTKAEDNDSGRDRILAIAASASGELLALSDDSKRLVLFRNDHTWTVVSVRWLVRRCTALVFTQAEDRLIVADKSGDVYSLSVKEPLQEPQLQLGHLSMVLDVTMSLDDRFIVTCDRDEKIRVSLLKSPYNIQSFCLGHQQFVSALLIPAGSSHSLLSGSGDGTVKLWDFISGGRLQSVDLREQFKPEEEGQRLTVSRMVSSPDGRHLAVQCEKVMGIQLFRLEQSEGGATLRPHSLLPFTHCPLDLTFDPEGRLWVLVNCKERPLQVYSHSEGSWDEVDVQSSDMMRVTKGIKPLWDSVDESCRSSSRFEHLYVEFYDNVSEYMKKKQERLDQKNQKNQKRSHGKGSEQNQSKKVKSQTTF